MVYTTLAGVQGVPDFSIFTWIGFTICFLVILFGAVRTMRAQGNPLERQKGMTTAMGGVVFVPAVALFIEIPHMLFFS